MRSTRRAVVTSLTMLVGLSSTSAVAQTSSTPTSQAPTAVGPTTGAPTTAPVTPDGRYRGFGDGGGFLNVLPPGQNAGVTLAQYEAINAALDGSGDFPEHYVDQLELYESLVHADDLTDDDLATYFKDASFGVEPTDIDRVYAPHDDVVVIRDKSYGVPHIYGLTRYATMYAQGFTTAEDRLFFMDVLRHVGRGRLAELIGYSDGFIGRDRDTVGSSPYTEADLTAQIEAFTDTPEGRSILADVSAYADGVNAFMAELADNPERNPVEYTLLGIEPKPWVPEDAVAIATLVGGIFGRGGGREVENHCAIERLTANLDGDRATARRIFDDLHFVDDDTVVTTDAAADYELGPPTEVAAGAHPELACGSLEPANDASPSTERAVSGFAGSEALLARDDAFAPAVAFLDSLARAVADGPHMSNALLVAADRTEAGRPIAVFGPQIGYSAPELLTEKDVHGPGIDARGVGFLGVDFYVLLGRGTRYAWSATSSGADNVDQLLVERCSTTTAADAPLDGYRRGGSCVAFETWQHTLDAPATPLAPQPKQVTWQVWRSEFGPVLWWGELTNGTPVAVVERRSTYGREVTSAIGFKQLNDPEFMAAGVDQFRAAAGAGIDYTFNWFYVDDRDIAMQDSCRCPVRAANVDPALPVLAGGDFDWTGEYLTTDQLPHSVNPDSGMLVNWNNRPAAGWGSSDAEFGYGPIHRSLALSIPLQARLDQDVADAGEIVSTVTRADVVTIMRDAGTQDLRGALVLPRLLDALGEPPDDVDPRLFDLRERLEIWSDSGAFRRDQDDDGAVDDPVAPSIMDAWWPRIVESVFGDDGDAFDALGQGPGSRDDSSTAASALIAAMDGSTDHPFCRSDGCRDEMWASLAAARADLAEQFVSDDPTTWQLSVEANQIEYATLLAGVPSMHWQNRPTFQQVVQLETELDRPEPTPDSTSTTTDDNASGDDGGGAGGPLALVAGVVALGAIVGGAIWRQNRRRRVR